MGARSENGRGRAPRCHARFMFEHGKTYRDEGLVSHPELFYDEGRGFFRFSDGTFAFSRERADWPALKEKGFFREYGL